MKLRTTVLIVAGAGIPLALIAMLLPITWGYGGFNWNFEPTGPPRVTFVDPAGPAARAGMHSGDIVVPLRGYDDILGVAGPRGTRVVEHLIRNGKPVTAAITFTSFSGALVETVDYSSENRHMLFIPMTLRGEVLGFLCCGPKPDHTPYLPDEISALSLLAHHVGIACAWLGGSREPVMRSTTSA